MEAQTNDKKWYAIYTRSKAEKKVHDALISEEIEAYLPLITRHKQWSDRIKKITEPLFSGYVFVHIQTKQLMNALNVPGALCFIAFEGKAVPIPPQQIEAIRYYILENDFESKAEHLLNEGQLVQVTHGTMSGLIGRLIRYNNKYRLVIRIEAVGKSITLSIPRSLVKAVRE